MRYGTAVLALAAMAVATGASAQGRGNSGGPDDRASANAKVEIIAPIEVVKAQDMEFGTVVASDQATTLELDSNGSVSGNAEVFGGNPQPAKFDVSGDRNRAYTIDLPSDGEVKLRADNGGTLRLTGFEDSEQGRSVLNGQGQDAFSVGATLKIGANQQPGDYTGGFEVYVNYE